MKSGKEKFIRDRKEKDGGGVMMRRGKSERERSTLRLYINA